MSLSSSPTTVLKFGGSVLRSEADLPSAVHEIYRQWRRGRRVLAVVAAFGCTADDLLKRAQQLGLPPQREGLAALLGTGETAAAALLTLALDRSGIPATLFDPTQIGLITEGDPLDADPVAVDVPYLRDELERAVVVVPGFVGRDRACRPTRLGRGGLDLTARFLARALDASCREAGEAERAGSPPLRVALLGCGTVGGGVLARLLAPPGRYQVTGAAVGGALPALETVRRAAAAGRVRSIAGVLNGTCNFVLDRCAAGASFPDAVSLARVAGYAEADPTLDLDGSDAAQKLSLLIREAFGEAVPWASIPRRGILEIDERDLAGAARKGRRIRLVASCERAATGLRAAVEPLDLPPDHPFADVAGAENALLVQLAGGDRVRIAARGAGRWPTTEAVLADLHDLAAAESSELREEGAA